MGDKTGIEWCDATWNPVLGCRKVSEGCRNCYAMRTAWRMSQNPNRKVQAAYAGLAKMTSRGAEWTGRARFLPERLEQPLRWSRPRRIFVNSMSDLFHPDIQDEEIDAVIAVIAAATQHTFQLLTKRPERMAAHFRRLEKIAERAKQGVFPHDSEAWLILQHLRAAAARQGVRHQGMSTMAWTPPNLWLGVSVEDRHQLARVDILRECPAAVRFLSCEPLLGPLGEINLDGIDQVIVGGESGPGARPMRPEWAREIRDQCRDQGVAFFFKQWGAHDALGDRVGKKRAGRLLDGQTHSGAPDVSQRALKAS